ncbi:chorismate mutase [Streptomyces bathyalis]|uniref:Chorismate mutase n=1 Tax=Streptomyces bathyalis TaxID=2710756 RepID=A0A7T1T5T1_9ACTN|nr:chorismate mutase [Streptomyces bathyalis]QPP06949.1 chorismate mutase [Streptomyces bathyalis]
MSTETAETTGRTGPDTTGAGAAGGGESGAESGTGARSRIDELDARIIALVQERRTVAAGVRQARTEAGDGPAGERSGAGEQVGLAREMEILNRYRSELGRPGTQLAMTLLALCRAQS